MLKIYTFQQFADRVKELEQIVCFGAGKRLEELENFFSNTEIWNKMQYIIDNDEKKQNKKVQIGEKVFEIISLKKLKEKNLKKFSILITCSMYSDIVKQLDEDEIFHNIDFYCLSHMNWLKMEDDALNKYVPLDVKLSNEPLIPKTIHYCWFGGNPLPDQYKIWMESWAKFCPDYKIIEWNEYNYDVTKNNYMNQAYQKKKWGFVPDYARLDIIYRYGGIYLDTDVELVQSIDDLLYQKGFVGFQNNKQVNLGLGFGAVKGLPIIKEMMDIYNDIMFINQDNSLNLIASPKWQTEILVKHGLNINGEYQIVSDLTIYPEKVLCGKNLYTRKIILKPYTKAVHHFDGSWLDETQKKKISQFEKELIEYK